MRNTAVVWAEYEAVKAVDKMDNVEVLVYVDKRVVCTREMTMPEYRIKAVQLMMEAQ